VYKPAEFFNKKKLVKCVLISDVEMCLVCLNRMNQPESKTIVLCCLVSMFFSLNSAELILV